MAEQSTSYDESQFTALVSVTLSSVLANNADSAWIFSLPLLPKGIFWHVLMAVIAVGLFCRYTTLHVFSMRHWLKMVRVDASADMTEVVNFETGRDRPPQQFVGNDVRSGRYALVANSDISVTVVADGHLPDPTRAFDVAVGRRGLLKIATWSENEFVDGATRGTAPAKPGTKTMDFSFDGLRFAPLAQRLGIIVVSHIASSVGSLVRAAEALIRFAACSILPQAVYHFRF